MILDRANQTDSVTQSQCDGSDKVRAHRGRRLACVATLGAISLALAFSIAPAVSFAEEIDDYKIACDSNAADAVAFNDVARSADDKNLELDEIANVNDLPSNNLTLGNDEGEGGAPVSSAGQYEGEVDVPAPSAGQSSDAPAGTDGIVEDDQFASGDAGVLLDISSGDGLAVSVADSVYGISYIKCDPNGNPLNGPGDSDYVEKTTPYGTNVRIEDVDPDYEGHFDGYAFTRRTDTGRESQTSVVVTGSGLARLRLFYIPRNDYSYVISVVNEDGTYYDGGAVNYRSGVTWDSVVVFEENGTNSDTFNTTYTPKPGYRVGKFFYKLDRNIDNTLNTDYICPDSMRFSDIVAALRRAGETFDGKAPLQLFGTFVMRDDYQVAFDVTGLKAGDGSQPNNRENVSWSSSDLAPTYDALISAPASEVVWTYSDSNGKTLAVSSDTTFADVYSSEFGDDASHGFVTLKAVYASDFNKSNEEAQDTDDPQEQGSGSHESSPVQDESKSQDSSAAQDSGSGQNASASGSSPTTSNGADSAQSHAASGSANSDPGQSSQATPVQAAATISNASVALTDNGPGSISYANTTTPAFSTNEHSGATNGSIPKFDSSVAEDNLASSNNGVNSVTKGTGESPVASDSTDTSSGNAPNPLVPVGLVLAVAGVAGFAIYAARRKRSDD